MKQKLETRGSREKWLWEKDNLQIIFWCERINDTLSHSFGTEVKPDHLALGAIISTLVYVDVLEDWVSVALDAKHMDTLEERVTEELLLWQEQWS